MKRPNWQFLMKHLGHDVGCAWNRDVGLPDEDFMIGITGTPKPKRKTDVLLHGVAYHPKHGKFTYDIASGRWSKAFR